MALNIRYVAADAAGGGDGTSEGTAWTLAEMASGASQNQHIYIKAGDYSSALTSAFTFPNVGTFALPVVYEGYTSTIGDGGTTKLVSSHNSDTSGSFQFDTPNGVFKNLHFTSPHTTGNRSCFKCLGNSDGCLFDNCIFERDPNTLYASDVFDGGNQAGALVRCLIIDKGTPSNWATYQNWAIANFPGVLIGCRVITLGGGVEFSNSTIATNCIIEGYTSNGTVGLSVDSNGARAINCTIRNFDDAIQVTAASPTGGATSLFVNNLLYGNTTCYGIKSGITIAATAEFMSINNAHGDYTTLYEGDLAANLLRFDEDIAITSDPFTNGATGDLSLNETAGAGGACRNAGLPDYHWDGDTTTPTRDLESNGDIGALEAAVVADYPPVKDVRYGVSFDSGGSEGTLTIPLASHVRDGVQFDDHAFDASHHQPSDTAPAEQTGTLDLPAESDVRDGTTFDSTTKTGTLDLPAEEDVEDGVQYDNTTKTGTYEPGVNVRFEDATGE